MDFAKYKYYVVHCLERKIIYMGIVINYRFLGAKLIYYIKYIKGFRDIAK